MTVCVARDFHPGVATLSRVIHEGSVPGEVALEEQKVRAISGALSSSYSAVQVSQLKANVNVCFQGVVPAGDGFKLRAEDVERLGFQANSLPPVIKRYIIGRDLVQRYQPKFIIDFFGITDTDARMKWSPLYQHVFDRVYPERKHNNRAAYRDRWWLFAEPRPAMRTALAGLRRFIVTPYTAKHRPFIFVESGTLPDAMAYAIASDDAFILGVLSSRPHVKWALTSGGRLGVGNDPRYTSNTTFLPFPFPTCHVNMKDKISYVAESLDSHRKDRQSQHTTLTLTDMYNVLEKLRSGEPLSERKNYPRGGPGFDSQTDSRRAGCRRVRSLRMAERSER